MMGEPSPTSSPRAQTRHLVSAGQLDQVRNLFAVNSLDLENKRVLSLETDDLGIAHVRVEELRNGRRIFLHELIYHFDQDGLLTTVSGDMVEKKVPPAEPAVAAVRARQVVHETIESMGLPPSDETLRAELGYLDLAALGQGDELVLVWFFHPESRQYPKVFVDANRGKVVYKDSGIRTGRM